MFTPFQTFLRLMITMTSIGLVIMNSVYYHKEYKYQKIKGFKVEINQTFWNSWQLKMFIVTNVVNIIHAPPYFEYQFVMRTLYYPVRYSLSTVLANLIFLRVYLIVRLFTTYSKWTQLESEEACEREGFQADFFFAIKSLMKQRPYLSIMFNFTVSILIFGFAVRSFER